METDLGTGVVGGSHLRRRVDHRSVRAERVYGQDDHVRLYGPDVVDRLRSVGLTVDVIPAAQFLSTQECERHAIDPAEEIFHCRRQG